MRGTSTIAEAVADMMAILSTERSAIRRLDEDEVIRCARVKDALAVRLREASFEELRDGAGALAALLVELRQNQSLLLYARACVREAQERHARKHSET